MKNCNTFSLVVVMKIIAGGICSLSSTSVGGWVFGDDFRDNVVQILVGPALKPGP